MEAVWSALVGPLGVAKGVAAVVLAAILALALRRRRAAFRHAVWTAALMVPLAHPLVAALPRRVRWTVAQAPAALSMPRPAVDAAPSVPRPVTERGGAPPERSEPVDFAPWFAAAWAVGAVLVAVRFGRGWWRAAAIVRRARPAAGSGRPRRLLSDEISVPMAWGGPDGVILVPATGRPTDADQDDATLRHEAAHLRRRDTWTQALAQGALVLQWCNPLLWLAYRAMLHERELACDEAVLAERVRPSTYAAALLHYAARPVTPTMAPPLLHRSGIEGRIRRVLGASSGTPRAVPLRGLAWGGLGMVALTAILDVAPAAARLASWTPSATAPVHGATVAPMPERRASVASRRRTSVRVVGARNGAIVVRGDARGTIAARATITGPDTTIIVELGDATRIDGEALLAAHAPWLRDARGVAVRLDLTVPARSDLTIESANGDIRVEGVTGVLRLTSVNGHLVLAGAAGTIDATTINGDVVGALGATGWSGEGSRLRSVNGAVRLDAPPGLEAHLVAASQRGALDVGDGPGIAACATDAPTCDPRRLERRVGRATVPLLAESLNADVRWHVGAVE